jgi:hypothetical protein
MAERNKSWWCIECKHHICGGKCIVLKYAKKEIKTIAEALYSDSACQCKCHKKTNEGS